MDGINSTRYVPILPMQAWSLRNARWDLGNKFVNWLKIEVESGALPFFLKAIEDECGAHPALRALIKWDSAAGYCQEVRLSNWNGVPKRCLGNVLDDSSAEDAAITEGVSMISNIEAINASVCYMNGSCGRVKLYLFISHYMSDFYSVTLLYNCILRRIASSVSSRSNLGSELIRYQKACENLHERCHNEVNLYKFLNSLTLKGTAVIQLPHFKAPTACQRQYASGADVEASLVVLSAKAQYNMRRAAAEMRVSLHIAGLVALLSYCSTCFEEETQFLLNIKESGRSLQEPGTIGLVGFLASTSQIAISLLPRECRTSLINRLVRSLVSRNEEASMTAGLLLHGNEGWLKKYEHVPKSRVLYNSVSIPASKTGSEYIYALAKTGLFRSPGYAKVEDVEVRFIFSSSSVSIQCFTRRGLSYKQTAETFLLALESFLCGDPIGC